MKTLRHLALGLLLTILAINGGIAVAASTSELLQQGLYAEEVEGNINAAIKTYNQVIHDKSAPRNHVAQALYRQGMCYLKLKDEAAARAALEKLVTEYSDQTEIVAKARPALDDLTSFDPAALMPPGTLLYVEFGAPGEQVETILQMLKGTPYENPLAAIGGRRPGNSNQRTPGDIAAALLNPSMLAEFKKIRSSAIGITGLQRNHPSMISVLYPGRSDALRGLILAALGVAGTPGKPIEGMQTVTMQDGLAVAYDDKVVIMTRPAGQLSWCVRQYKGLSSDPSLASANTSFVKISKNERSKNALTLWANVDATYAEFLKMFPAGRVPPGVLSANAIGDFTNINDLIVTASVETNGLRWKADVQFKGGHHCLAYDLIRTPNLSPAALEAVPANAIALACFALSPTGARQAEKVRNEIQDITGLDVGRELFANLQQITVFMMPAGGSAAGVAGLDALPAHLGLALTSRNPGQTRQLLETLLGTTSTVSAGRPSAESGRYRVGKAHGHDLYCYLKQVNGTTLLSLNRDVLDAAVTSIRNHRSIRTSGPLHAAVNRLAPATSKLLLINAGGAVRLLGPQSRPGILNEEQTRQFDTSLEQLARAADVTTLELRTDERPNELGLNAGIDGMPPLNAVLGPATRIAGVIRQARAEAAAKHLRQEAPATVVPTTKAPVIDGQPDACWNDARSYKLENVIFTPPASPADLSGSFKTMWDETNLYVLVDVTDDILKHDTDDWFQSDGVEIYIDADDAKAQEYGQNDYQYAFNWDETSPEIRELKHNRTNDVRFGLVKTEKGYRVEVAFPWSTLGVKPSVGARVGLDVEINDNDGNHKRDSKLAWHDKKDIAWQTPSVFGNAQLAGLIGWWKFDETQGKVAADSSGGHHNGSLVGNAKWAPGRVGGAVALDGAGSFVRIADKSAFNLAGQLTLAAWVNLHSVPVPWTAIVTKGDGSWRLSTVGQERRFHFSLNHDARADSTTAVNTDEWHHVTAVYDKRALRLYVDGKLDATQPWTGTIDRNNFDVLIGDNAEHTNRCFNGLIDDVRIYDYALPESEIKALAVGQ